MTNVESILAVPPRSADLAKRLLEKAGGDRARAQELAILLRNVCREAALAGLTNGFPLLTARFAQELLESDWSPT